MSTEKGRQHYIPKFYLRNFSYNDNKKQIGIFNKATNRFVEKGGLKTQAYKDFFYGADGEIEEKLSTIENDIAPLIADIMQTCNLPHRNSVEYASLLYFTLLTHHRTPAASNGIIGQQAELVKRLMEMMNAEGPIEEGIHISTQAEAIKLALDTLDKILPFCEDLECKLLVNRTSTPFITSDNPVVKYNSYVEIKDSRLPAVGYGSRGFSMFFPIGPKKMLVFFDRWAYEMGERKKMKIDVIDGKDIFQLNLLQLLNCDDNIFFNHEIKSRHIEGMVAHCQLGSNSNAFKSRVMDFMDPFGLLSEKSIIEVRKRGLGIGLTLASMKLTKNAKYYYSSAVGSGLRPQALALSKKLDKDYPNPFRV